MRRSSKKLTIKRSKLNTSSQNSIIALGAKSPFRMAASNDLRTSVDIAAVDGLGQSRYLQQSLRKSAFSLTDFLGQCSDGKAKHA